MRSPALYSSRSAQQGLSLIELLVSITIGLILVVAILSAYLGTSMSSKVAEAQGRMNEDAQAALTILSQQLRMAGNNPKQPDYASTTPTNPVFGTSTYAIRGCDGTFSNLSTAADIASLTCGGGGGPDSIAVSYEADAYNTVKTTSGKSTDCLGVTLPTVTGSVNKWNGVASVPTSVTYTVADNRFYIGTSGVITAPSLYCKGNGTGGSPQPLVENVEDMQFIYGTAPSTTTTLSIAGYLNAGEILSDPGLAALTDDPTRWGKVVAVRICVLVRSEQPVAPDATSAQYIPCPSSENSFDPKVAVTPVAAPDLRLRKAYSTTVILRNRVTP